MRTVQETKQEIFETAPTVRRNNGGLAARAYVNALILETIGQIIDELMRIQAVAINEINEAEWRDQRERCK